MKKENKILIPKKSRLRTYKSAKLFYSSMNQRYSKDMFDTVHDWFFFVHVHPVQRYIHAFGMFVGLYFFFMMFYEWGLISLLYYSLGVFFFYGFGIISHWQYDNASARSEARDLLRTLYPVIRINLLTVTGNYDKALREFVERYPFVREAYELIEIDSSELVSHLNSPLDSM